VQQPPVHFVLDHNFPYQVVNGLDWPPYIHLSALKDIAPNLVEEPDDWRILLALAAMDDVHGYITNDAAMLDSAEEVVALTRTRLALVVTSGVGHNPLRASGLLLTYLSEIARQVQARSPRAPVVYRISAARLGDFRRTPGQLIDALAQRKRVPPQDLVTETLRKIRPS
jgi:hypothetical protein